MNFMDYLKTSRFPTTWCPGCGNGTALIGISKAFEELGLLKKNLVVVSGIGCAGRSAGYFALDSVHALHGRSVPVAEGIKLANDKLKVVIVSGDGDLLGIGGNHLLHASRRGTPLCIICFNNETYGMTGGQKAPTTKLGTKTLTSPEGVCEKPVDIQSLIKPYGNFYARTTVYHADHLKKAIAAGLQHEGFAFVEVISQCIANFGRRIGFKSAYDMLKYYKDYYKLRDDAETLKEDEIGITKA